MLATLPPRLPIAAAIVLAIGVGSAIQPTALASEPLPVISHTPAPAPAAGRCVFGEVTDERETLRRVFNVPRPDLNEKPEMFWIHRVPFDDLERVPRKPSRCIPRFDRERDHDRYVSAEELTARANQIAAIGIATGGECHEHADLVLLDIAFRTDRGRGGCGLTPQPDAFEMWNLAATVATTTPRRQTALALAANIAWDRAQYSDVADITPWIDTALAMEYAAVANPADPLLAELTVAAWDNAVRNARAGVACTTRETLGRIEAGLRRAPAREAAARVLALLPDR